MNSNYLTEPNLAAAQEYSTLSGNFCSVFNNSIGNWQVWELINSKREQTHTDQGK